MSILKKNNAAWFSFKGVTNSEMHVAMLSMPVTTIPPRNGKKQPAAGRSGFLWQDDNSYGPTTVHIQCITTGDADQDDVNAWLTGSGDLMLSSEPNRVRKAYAVRETSKTFRFDRLNGQEFQIAFDCQPYKYLSPAPAAITVAESGDSVNNPGSADAQPVFKLTGRGDITLFINGYQVDVDGLGTDSADGTIVIDSELQECFNEAHSELLNDLCVIDVFPSLKPGENIIEWAGDVTQFKITEPRWRFL